MSTDTATRPNAVLQVRLAPAVYDRLCYRAERAALPVSAMARLLLTQRIEQLDHGPDDADEVIRQLSRG